MYEIELEKYRNHINEVLLFGNLAFWQFGILEDNKGDFLIFGFTTQVDRNRVQDNLKKSMPTID